MKKEIKVMGETLTIAFNLATQITYKKITEVDFNGKDLEDPNKMVALYMACILANNPDTKITIDNILLDIKQAELATLSSAVAESMAEFYDVPIDKDEKKESKGKPTKRSRAV